MNLRNRGKTKSDGESSLEVKVVSSTRGSRTNWESGTVKVIGNNFLIRIEYMRYSSGSWELESELKKKNIGFLGRGTKTMAKEEVRKQSLQPCLQELMKELREYHTETDAAEELKKRLENMDFSEFEEEFS